MSYKEERAKYPDLVEKKSIIVKGFIRGEYLVCEDDEYLIMQDDLDYIMIQGLKIEGKTRRGLLSQCTIDGKIVIKAKLISVWNQ